MLVLFLEWEYNYVIFYIYNSIGRYRNADMQWLGPNSEFLHTIFKNL
jgi:hypothetical protein